jgi:hypothetical protein
VGGVDRHDGAGQAVRHGRAAVLSAVVLVVSLLAHLHGGGDAPPLTGLVAGWALLTVLLSRLTRHELGLPLVLGLLTGGQLLVHLALQEAAAATSPAVAAAAARMTAASGGHHHHAGMADLPSPAPVAPVDPMTVMGDGGWTMLASHLLAAVVVGVWLVAGERAAWRLVQVVVVAVLRSVDGLAELLHGRLGWVCPVVAGPADPPRRVWLVVAEVEQLALGSSSRRRGPPTGGRPTPPCR